MFDIESQTAVQERFGLEALDYSEREATAVMRLALPEMTHPVSNAPSLALVAVLVDEAASKATFARRGEHVWPVTSDLSIQFHTHVPSTLGADGDGVTCHAKLVYATGFDAVAACTLTVGNETIGTATMRSVYIPGELLATHRPAETLVKTSRTSLADLMSIAPARDAQSVRFLRQSPDPMVFNAIANIHGGVAAAGLELAAMGAISDATGRGDFRSGVLHVNFLRPFIAGDDSRYVGATVHAGSSVGVADAKAIGHNGKIAAVARLTAYRATE